MAFKTVILATGKLVFMIEAPLLCVYAHYIKKSHEVNILFSPVVCGNQSRRPDLQEDAGFYSAFKIIRIELGSKQ